MRRRGRGRLLVLGERFVADAKPTHAGGDPYNLYIDRNSGDYFAAAD